MADFHFCVCVPAVLPNLHIPWIQGASQTLQCHPAASHPKSKLLLDSEIYGLEESKGGDISHREKVEQNKKVHSLSISSEHNKLLTVMTEEPGTVWQLLKNKVPRDFSQNDKRNPSVKVWC